MKVILAADGTLESDLAEAMASRLCRPETTHMTAVQVVDVPARIRQPIGHIPEPNEAQQKSQQVAERTLASIADRLSRAGFKTASRVLSGRVADELLHLISAEKPDLVAAGSGGKNSLEAFLMGSVSRKLVLYSESSVLIGRHPQGHNLEESSLADLSARPLSVMVAVDGSEGSKLALETLAAVKEPIFQDAYTLCVEPLTSMAIGIDPFFYGQMFQEEMEACQKLAERAAEQIAGCAKQVTPISEIGRPSTIIARKAKQFEVDLVIMGASRHGAMERLFLGSCAYETLNVAPCSVLILRDKLELDGVPHFA